MAKKSTRLEALHSIFEENRISSDIIELSDSVWLSGKEDSIHEKAIVLIDGKESRGSKRKFGEQGEVKALQALNVYSSDYGICLAQKFIEEKTNEIPATQELLGLMELRGMIRTADAMNYQKRYGLRNCFRKRVLCPCTERKSAAVL